MTDKLKIMTDNEIIKAFKDFLIEQVDGYTDHIETGGERYEFIEKELELLKETDNLINRQQAEIERLNGNLKFVRGTVERQRVDINNLNKAIDNYEACLKSIEKIKVEAYKEFAERLKERAIQTSFDPIYGSIMTVDVDDVDNLLKELVGENNA